MDNAQKKQLEKKAILEKIKASDRIMSSDVGQFIGVSPRTIQKWTDEGLVRTDDSLKQPGTGHRREYSAEDCIRCGIIKKLSDKKVPFKYITKIMDELESSRYIRAITLVEYAFLLVYENQGDNEFSAHWHAHFPKHEDLAPQWVEYTCRPDTERVCIFNMSLLGEKILNRIEKEIDKKK